MSSWRDDDLSVDNPSVTWSVSGTKLGSCVLIWVLDAEVSRASVGDNFRDILGFKPGAVMPSFSLTPGRCGDEVFLFLEPASDLPRLVT